MTFFVDAIMPALIVLVLFTIWWYANVPSNLPPGPLGVPIFGSTFQTWKSATLLKRLLKWTEIYGPVYRLYIGNKLVIVLGDWNAIHEALVKQGDTYAGRPVFNTILPEELAGPGIINSEGEMWKIQRRFAAHTLRDLGFGRPILEPRIHDEADYLLEAIGKNEDKPFDIAPLLHNAVSNIICALVFGKRFQFDDHNFHQLLGSLRSRLTETDTSVLTPFVLSKRVAQLMTKFPQVKRLKGYSAEMIGFIKTQTSEVLKNFKLDESVEPSNYIEAFYKAQLNKEDNWTFTDAQLIASVANLFIAGTDTTSTTLRWAIFLMAHHPEIQDKVYDEIKKETGCQSLPSYADRSKLPFTEATIMETHRYANMVPVGVMRRTLAPSKLFGYDIPVGTAVVPLLSAVLGDPKTYPNPNQFDPNRFMEAKKNLDVFTHLIPFQIGKRVCLGESLTKMEMFIVFSALISKYKFYFSPDEAKPPLKARISLIVSPVPFKICAERRTE